MKAGMEIEEKEPGKMAKGLIVLGSAEEGSPALVMAGVGSVVAGRGPAEMGFLPN